MYFKDIESDKDAKIAQDNKLKINAKERLAANSAYRKKQRADRRKAQAQA